MPTISTATRVSRKGAGNWAMAANPQRDGKGFRWLRMTSLVMIVITVSVIDTLTGIVRHRLIGLVEKH